MRLNRVRGSLLSLAAAVAGWLAAAPVAGAQGFGLNEIGTCAVARQAAVTAAPCNDASMIYWNPAAPSSMPGRFSLLLGVAPIGVGGDFTQDTTGTVFEGDVPWEFPPHAFLNYSFGDRFKYRWASRVALGLGVYVPYGLTSQWHSDFIGRFSAQKASLQTIYVQPNLSFEVIPGRLSLGGGPVFGHSTLELRQSLDLADQRLPTGATFGQIGIARGTEFGRAELKGDGTAWGAHFGAHARLTPTINVGVRWLWSMYFDYTGDATFRRVPTALVLSGQLRAPDGSVALPAGTILDTVLAKNFATGGLLVDQDVTTAIKHPGQVQFGIGYTGLEGTQIGIDGQWIRWSDFDALPVNFAGPARVSNRALIEDYEDSWSFRVGAERNFAGLFKNGFAGRIGYSFVQTPAPDVTVTPLLPDQDRNNFALGVGVPLGRNWAFDASYLKVDTEGRRGRVAERPSRTITDPETLNSGFYRLSANIWSFSLKAQF
ncbi:MAG TPA: outer membrane protein transport protein [Gemmatimonadaceae bacterium]|nr:outer membrane protein transport protein [Gemmatimonadaceae bacterium]